MAASAASQLLDDSKPSPSSLLLASAAIALAANIIVFMERTT
jgi:hypothetical protein